MAAIWISTIKQETIENKETVSNEQSQAKEEQRNLQEKYDKEFQQRRQQKKKTLRREINLVGD